MLRRGACRPRQALVSPAHTYPCATRPYPLVAAPSGGLVAVSLSLRLNSVTNSLRSELTSGPAPTRRPDRSPKRPPLGHRQMNDVIESCKYHQHQNDRDTNAKTDFLGLFGQRPPPNALDQVEQKVTAIEKR